MPEGGGATATSINRETFAAQIYAQLEAQVLSGELLPGTKLSEESVAEMFGVSRSPAREALTDLERVGLAIRSGPRDRVIMIPTEELVRKKYDVWWIIDAGRTYLASQYATPADYAELRGYIDKMAESVKKKNGKAYRQLSDAFHQKFRSVSNNEFLNQFGSDCDVYLKWFENLYDRTPEISMETVKEHYSILQAYERKDLAGLYESIKGHLIRQRDRILLRLSTDEENRSDEVKQSLATLRR